ncbi:MAG: phosphate-starvation-inducible PsiE family protein [Halodesulfurarchaeum sp.]
MTNDREEGNSEGRNDSGEGPRDQIVSSIETFVHLVELTAASVFAILFAIGVVDLIIQIGQAVLAGRITSPYVVIGIIDTGLLLLIIVEVYKTVIAYVQESETRRIVRLILYTGLIAMVRKIIIFRIHDYSTVDDALFAAVSYTILLTGLGVVLLIEQHTTR